ncbi:MAG: LacI family DNA-binding transcriptional regulator, partial [Alphaproteobacteria bacterium]
MLCLPRSSLPTPPKVCRGSFGRCSTLRRPNICMVDSILQLAQEYEKNAKYRKNNEGKMSRRGKRLNQSDIAERLGVSVSTVSRALANEVGISPTVRDDVRQMARTMGYRSKRSGATLLDRRITAFVPLGSATSGLSGFYFGIVEGMRSAAVHAGISLDVRLINETAPTVDFIRNHIKDTGAIGLLLAGIDATDELVAWSQQEDLPVVLVNGSDPQMRWSSVAPANFYGSFAVTRRLLDAGHR